MSHPSPSPTLWRCACQMPLGMVEEQGRLRTFFPGAVDRWGSVVVACPLCRKERVWRPESAAAKGWERAGLRAAARLAMNDLLT